MSYDLPVVSLGLRELELVDAPPEPAFDNLVHLASRLFGTPVALVTVVDFAHDRQFFKSQLGLPEPLDTAGATPLSHSFCRHVVEDDAPLVIEDARTTPRVRDNPAVGELGVIAYLGAPFHHPDGRPLGSLCAIDTSPHAWTDADVETLERLAACVTDAIRLKAMQRTSESLRAEQSAFTFAISHDLRAPMITLHGLLSEAVHELTPAGEREELVALGLRTVKRATALIDGVLDYAGFTGDAAAPETVDLDATMAAVREDLRGDLATAGAELTVGALPSVQGHPEQLRMLLQNLVANATRYRRDDVPLRIEVSASESPDRIAIVVRDNGMGIAPTHHERIFGLFAQLNPTDAVGSGVGLAICRRIAGNHGGVITLDSALGEGSTFTIGLPRHV